jgi:Excalibur calcium-binding domain
LHTTSARRLRTVLVTVALAVGGTALALPADAHTTGIHDNCTSLNKKWHHGVGRKGAHDKGGTVTNFYRNTKQYNLAVRHNGTLDRDHDGIACEKK